MSGLKIKVAKAPDNGVLEVTHYLNYVSDRILMKF